MYTKIVLLLILYPMLFLAQKKNGMDTVHKSYKNWDTLKYQKFERVLIVGVYQQHRTFSNEFKQLINVDTLNLSSHTYSTEIDFAGAAGITLSYDKFQLSVGKGIKPPETAGKRGHTDVFNIGLNVGDNRWISENYYRRFKGFYNIYSANIDSNYKKENQYYIQPSMLSSLFMTRFMYFKNYENYSFKSGVGCNYRQLKSSLTLVFGGSFSVFNLRNDSSIVPIQSRHLYNDFGSMRGLQSVNISGNIGLAGTLVLFKAWFIGGNFTIGPEQQWRNYDLTTSHRRLSYIGWSGTGRFSMGLNLKRFYFIYSFSNDYNVYDSKSLRYRANSFTSTTALGWRFNVKTPKFYQKFMNTKAYTYL